MNFIRICSLALCAMSVVACSDSRRAAPVEPDVDSEAPTLTLQFPSADSYTDLAAITVRGSASDNEALTNVTVNGSAAMTVDDFANWEAAVTLAPGVNTVTIEATDATGNMTSKTIDVVSERGQIDRPFGWELDADSDTLYYVDIDTFKIMTITLADGEVAEFADLSQFVPTSATDTPPLDLALDLASGSVYLTVASDAAAGSSSVGIWRYDVPAETWNAFSDSTIDANAVLQVPSDVVLDSANNRLLVIDFFATSIVAVSLTDGSQSVLNPNPSIPLSEPTDAVIDAQANRLLVTNRRSDNIISVDLTTGSHTLVTDNNIDADPALRESLSIVLDETGGQALVQDPVTPGLIAVDLATGLRTGVSANSRNPISLGDTRSLALREGEVLALDNRFDHVVAIDLDTEERRIITNNGFPRGTASWSVTDIEATESGVYAQISDAAILVGGENGLEFIAGSTFDVTQQMNIEALTVDYANLVAYAIDSSSSSSSEYQVTEIDLTTGATQIISDGGLPDDNNPLDNVQDVVVDSANNRLLVLTTDQVLAVDLSTGSRTVFSDDASIAFSNPIKIYVDSVSNRYLVVDGDNSSLIAIDNDGNRSLFATMAAPGDSSPEFMDFLAIDSDGDLWLYDIGDRLMEIDAETGARTPRLDVTTQDRVRWFDMDIVDDVVYAVVDRGVVQLDLRTDESVVIYGSAPVSSGNE